MHHLLVSPHRDRTRKRWTGWAFAVGIVMTGVIALVTDQARAASGLYERPSNTTCVAKKIPVANALVKAVPAFPGLNFVGVTQLRQHPFNPDVWYVSERRGLIKAFNAGATSAITALDLSGRMVYTKTDVSDSQQWGVTSFVFHPGFAGGDRYLFVAYNRKPLPSGLLYSYLSRFTANPDGVTFDPNSEVVMLALPQTTVWHHFGQLEISPIDQHLFLGSGDGAGTPPNALADRAQDWNSLYGSILRIWPYAEKPILWQTMGIYAKGFRNPWRFSFDSATGDLWLGDVGEDSWEEIDHITAPFGNYGWPVYEGPECKLAACDPQYYQPPTYYFDHSEGAAAIGGFVYHGTAIPALSGYYIFGSASHPRLWALPPGSQTRVEIGSLPRGIPTGFFQDNRGELYVIDTPFNGLWKLVPNTGQAQAEADPVPPLLSQTGCVVPQRPGLFASGVIPYDVNNPLWSDGAGKKRGMALPDSQRIMVRASNFDFDMPVRSVLIKSFYLGNKPIETRLFMQHPDGAGWRGYTYEWVGADAVLLSTGKYKQIGAQTWYYPSREQCMQCHNPAAGGTLGLEIAQINRNFTYPSTGLTANQMETFQAIGLFGSAIPPANQWHMLRGRTGGPVTERARAYLHSNCSFCHRPGGGAQANMDLRYWIPTPRANVCNVPPLGTNLGIPDARLLAPGAPERSILYQRMARRDGEGMPPLATLVPDYGMLPVIDAWIRTPGICP